MPYALKCEHIERDASCHNESKYQVSVYHARDDQYLEYAVCEHHYFKLQNMYEGAVEIVARRNRYTS
jgi:hypothetical protein